jgi:hypothetical protein
MEFAANANLSSFGVSLLVDASVETEKVALSSTVIKLPVWGSSSSRPHCLILKPLIKLSLLPAG